MRTEVKKEIQLEIAHVLFMDIVGYSKLLIDEQHALLETLNRIVRNTQQFRNAEEAGKLIKIPTGDGMALVFQDRLDAPVECALEISRALKEHPTLPLRMGVHSGPVSGVIDVNERANVTGAGINMAQRLMDCGDAGHILLSKHVAEDLEQYARWKPLLHDLGECEVKHGVRVHVVSLYTDELGNAEPPEKFKLLRSKKNRGMASLTRFSEISTAAKSLINWGKRSRIVFVCFGVAFVLAVCWLGISIFRSRSTPSENLRDAAAASDAYGKPLNLAALASKARGAVVFIQGYDSAGRIVKTGSGFFITSGGRLVTNNHVIQGTATAQAKLQNGAIYNITGVLSSSKKLDLAVLQADARDVEILLVDSGATPPEPGTRIAVIGSPLAMEGSLSEGIVAANRAGEDESWLQITAPISPGSSGSPVLDRHGSVVGVATLVAQQGQNVNFARSARDLWNFLRTVPSDAKPQPLVDLAALEKDRILSDPDFIKARNANATGNAASALKSLNLLVQKYPGDSRLLFEVALAYQTLGLQDEAYESYRAYIEDEPTDTQAWYNLATVARNLNRVDEAINACQQTLKIKKDVMTLRLLAELYQSQGRSDLSAQAKQQADELGSSERPPSELGPLYVVVAPGKQVNLRSDANSKSDLIQKDWKWFDTWRAKIAEESGHRIEVFEGSALLEMLAKPQCGAARQKLRDWGIRGLPMTSAWQAWVLIISNVEIMPKFVVAILTNAWLQNVGDKSANAVRIRLEHTPDCGMRSLAPNGEYWRQTALSQNPWELESVKSIHPNDPIQVIPIPFREVPAEVSLRLRITAEDMSPLQMLCRFRPNEMDLREPVRLYFE